MNHTFQPRPSLIALIGFMGAGKTTVGRILAERLGYDFVDTDALVVAGAGVPIAEIFQRQGEAAFRRMESLAIRSLAGRAHTVIAAGGGAPVQEANQDFFRISAITFHLKVSLENALERARVVNGPVRPLLSQRGDQAVQWLFDARRTIYESLGVPVETDGHTPLKVAEKIMSLLQRPTGSPAAEGRPADKP